MSTAGKVLVVLVLLTSLVWIVLASGVAQLNTNGNTRLHELTEQIEKLQTDFKQTQDEIASLRDQTSSIQEDVDREVTVLRAHQSDVEKARSQIQEMPRAGSISARDSQGNHREGQRRLSTSH